MRIDVIGSRNLWINNLGKYLPDGVTKILSGGANKSIRLRKQNKTY